MCHDLKVKSFIYWPAGGKKPLETNLNLSTTVFDFNYVLRCEASEVKPTEKSLLCGFYFNSAARLSFSDFLP